MLRPVLLVMAASEISGPESNEGSDSDQFEFLADATSESRSSSEVEDLRKIENWEDIEDSRQYLAEQHEANFTSMVQNMERRAADEPDEGETIDLITLRPVKAPRRDYPDPWKSSEDKNRIEGSPNLLELEDSIDSESDESDSLSVAAEDEEVGIVEANATQSIQPTPFHTACISGSNLLDRVVTELIAIANSS